MILVIYEVVHSGGSSEVMHLACVCTYQAYIILSNALNITGVVSSALVYSCGNSEVTTFIMCAHYYQVYFQILYTFRYWILTIVGSTHLCRVVGMVVRYDIWHENCIYQVYFQIPEVVIMWFREFYISL